VELLRPAPDEPLVSGRRSTVAWRPLRDLSAEGIVEWEAFLSFDGGRSWPVRATPHLDIGRPSFDFTLPMVPSDDVRIMLRFGDERRELGYVLPTVYRSVVPAGAWTPPVAPDPVLDRGEPALSGAAGVVVWVDGARDGRRTVSRSAAWRPVRAAPPGSSGRLPWPVAVAPDQRGIEPASRADDCSSSSRPAACTAPVRAVGLVFPLLLLVCRRDE
jgi:hypothetical protein